MKKESRITKVAFVTVHNQLTHVTLELADIYSIFLYRHVFLWCFFQELQRALDREKFKVRELQDGKNLSQEPVPINSSETVNSLLERVKNLRMKPWY